MALKSVTAGQSLNLAAQNALPGDVLSVEADASFPGPVILTDKGSSTPITIQSSRIAELPPDKRVTPADAGKMPKIIGNQNQVSPSDPPRAILTRLGAHHWNLLGLGVTHDPTIDYNTLISLGDGNQTSLDQVAHSLVLDRMFVHGHSNRNLVRGVALNSAKTDILNSYFSEIHHDGSDAQAVCGWAGPGPYRMLNNYFEASGENVMFGGADPKIQGLIPSDIEIRQSHFFKPFTWKIGHPSYAGRAWVVKNLFETKNARRLIVEGNLFENNWTHGQAGAGIVIKCNNQDSTAPWSVTEDLLFQYNHVISEAGINMLLIENLPKISAIGKRIYYRHNFLQVERLPFQGPVSGEDVRIEHNTWTNLSGPVFMVVAPNVDQNGQFVAPLTKGLIFNNNLGRRAEYGIKGDSRITGAEGTAALNAYFLGTWDMKGNVMSGAPASQYPAGNFYPATWAEVQAGTDYRLAASSPFKGKATDGKDPGVDWVAFDAAMKGASVPTPAPSPAPTPTPAPTPIPTPSPDGTKGVTITDAQGGVWTIGTTTNETLRNKVWMGGGQCTEYKYLNKEVYAKGFRDGLWYKWTGDWVKAGDGSEPGGVIQPPEPVPTPTPVPPKEEYVSKGFRKLDVERTALYQEMWKQGYGAWEELEGNNIKFRLFPKP